MIKIGYVDDEVDESITGATHYRAPTVVQRSPMRTNFHRPKWEEFDNFVKANYNLFLIDYELDRVQSDQTKANYRGTTLTAEIRARLPDSPYQRGNP